MAQSNILPSALAAARFCASRIRSTCTSRTFSSTRLALVSQKPVAVPTAAELDTFVGMKSEFPCLQGTAGPEPTYSSRGTGAEVYHHDQPFKLRWGGVLPEVNIAYETWGTLNEERNNVICIFCGVSPTSHAKSNEKDPSDGWWEEFIGPNRPLDTNHFFIICANNLGSCFGTTGPSSTNPLTGEPYAMSFPIITLQDCVRAQFLLLDHLGIGKIYGAVGASAGGMLSIAAGVLFTDRVERIVSISAGLKSLPSAIAFRFMQRQSLMGDPNWNLGNYYGKKYPARGMKWNRMLGMLTYRCGPEWENRFGLKRVTDDMPSMCPDFEIESYLDHQGHKLGGIMDPNSQMYLSKAVDLFHIADGQDSYDAALEKIKCPVLVVGVQTDILIPVSQQKHMASELRRTGNTSVTYFEIDTEYGHDTFLLDRTNVGTAMKGFLELGNQF
ncbi:uncharacterized protein LOC135823830 [Sycon ciliatum]|uniref:uncharacterized protein LOC135823830 n=1 Tax=Sycon ciliatum TaxID=27933 RepID=UPI0031F64461